MTQEQKLQIKQYFWEGYNYNQIAAIYMIPAEQIKNIVNEEIITISDSVTTSPKKTTKKVENTPLFEDEDGL
jgi:uncharacterized protein YjcR